MELDYLNRCEQDLLQAVQDAEAAVTELRRFAASFLLMQNRRSTLGTNTTTIPMHSSTKFQVLFWMKLSHSAPLCFFGACFIMKVLYHKALIERRTPYG